MSNFMTISKCDNTGNKKAGLHTYGFFSKHFLLFTPIYFQSNDDLLCLYEHLYEFHTDSSREKLINGKLNFY